MKNLLNDSSIPQTIECLGLAFDSDESRRAYFLEQLGYQLRQPDFTQSAGFPVASETAILALSDPPYYTACPNPWFTELLSEWTSYHQEDYHREPFTTDVREGKNDPIYNAHSYHTKVPHKAIMRYLLHYTRPGDIVFDSFCGTGMTGIAAQLCGDPIAVETLGYRVLPNGTIEKPIENELGQWIWKPFSQLGARRAILNDLSPAATFIAYHYNTPFDMLSFEQAVQRVLQAVEAECGWMYQTLHHCSQDLDRQADEIQSVILGETDCPGSIVLGRINYIVWSDVFICSECAGEVIFWHSAVNQQSGTVYQQFPCPHCQVLLEKRLLQKAWVTRFDKALQQTLRQAKQVPVLISYSVGKQRYQKDPDRFDLALLEKIEQTEIPYWFPTDPLPNGDSTHQPIESHGITHLHHFYTARNLQTLACFRAKIQKYPKLSFLLTGIVNRSTKMNRIHLKYFFFGGGGWNAGYLKGTLYMPSLPIETSILEQINDRLKNFKQAFGPLTYLPAHQVAISTMSAQAILLKDNSVDYVFLDPPFGSNLMYSELNFLWEAWLKVFTNNTPEAIINKTQGKELTHYKTLMVNSFKEAFRLLKPGHWMTVEFSNTQAKIWNTLQTALQTVGFIIANVSALDKKQGSFKAVTTTTAVKQDLIISAYKPDQALEIQIQAAIDSEERVWAFVHHHLKYLPVVKGQSGQLEFIAEREPRILYDRMVAYLINQGYSIPLSSPAFQVGLQERFAEQDGMIFLFDQLADYEQKRQQVKQPPQMELFVCDERSAIDWLYHFLKKRPATYQEIHPRFTQLLGAGWKKHEVKPELETLLEFNFLKYNGTGTIPPQIQTYLSQHFDHTLTPDEIQLRQQALERWYVPDPNEAQDLEKMREHQLLREFKRYCQNSNKRLKTLRLEALQLGFKKAWEHKNYQTIIDVANKMPETLLYEDEKLLQFYDLAMMRMKDF